MESSISHAGTDPRARPNDDTVSRQHPLSSRQHTLDEIAEQNDYVELIDPDGDSGDADMSSTQVDIVTAAHGGSGIAISSTGQLVGKRVAPFLSRHIPKQYAPQGDQKRTPTDMLLESNTKYCYRHRPDLKCRRKVNEPSMEHLQNELASLSGSDQQGIAHVWSLFSAAPSKHRNLMLQGILAQCCFPQLSMISSSVRDLIKIDFLAALPPEIGLKILMYLDAKSLCQAALVSRRWRELADDDAIWHRMCEQHIGGKCKKCGIGLPLRLRNEERRARVESFTQTESESNAAASPMDTEAGTSRESSVDPHTSPMKRKADQASADDLIKRVCTKSIRESTDAAVTRRRRPWKEVYRERHKVGLNWRKGRYNLQVLKGHRNGVMCLQLNGNTLATGSYDSTIKIWCMKTGTEIRTLEGHTSGVRCLQFDDTLLMSGSIDKTLKVWNWRTGECIRTFHDHSGGILGLHFVGPYIASASMDKTVRVLDRDRQAKFTLRGHADWVNAVKIDLPSRTLFSASDDMTVKLWDLNTHQCLRTFTGHVGQVQQVLLLPHDFELDDDTRAALGSDSDEEDSVGRSDTPISSSTRPQLPTAEAAQAPTGSRSRPNTCAEPETQPSSQPVVTPLFPGHPTYHPSRPSPPRYMLTSSLDSTICLWDVSLGLPLKKFFGHLEGVWALAGDRLRIVSGSEDRMVKVWDARTGHCERTYGGHEAPVTCVAVSDDALVSGGEDGTVRILGFCGVSFRDDEQVPAGA